MSEENKTVIIGKSGHGYIVPQTYLTIMGASCPMKHVEGKNGISGFVYTSPED